MSSFSNIDEYIAGFDGEKKALLQNIRQLIKDFVPEAKETINYNMPTYRLNGNLIHFAMFKNHLGLYPGPDTINDLKDDLIDFKTTKGAIQIPLDIPIPKDLIQKILLYKIDSMKDQKAGEWTKYNGNWAEANEKITQIINNTVLKKEFKWGGDVYTYKKKNVLAFSGFKNHFALWFYNGVLLQDKYNVLVNANEEKTKALRQWRFNSADEIEIDKVKQYVEEAINLVENGIEFKFEKPAPKEPEGLLKNALNQNNTLLNSFNTLSKSKQKEYIEYIEEAKQEKTKLSRIEKIKPLILGGKGLNDKYRK